MYPNVRNYVIIHVLEVISNTCIRRYVRLHALEVISNICILALEDMLDYMH